MESNRDKARRLQDELLAMVGHMDDDTALSYEYAGSPTISDMRKHIYPDWIPVITDVIETLKRGD